MVRSPKLLAKWVAITWLTYNDFSETAGQDWGHPYLPKAAAADAVGDLAELRTSVAGQVQSITREAELESSARNTDAEVLVMFHSKLRVGIVSFRGSDHYTDAITNTRFLPRQYISVPGVAADKVEGVFGKAHSGFVRHQESTEELLRRALDDSASITPATPLVFVGHSLGGAAAALAALKYSVQFPDRLVGLVTVACPRIGDPVMARYLGNASGIPQTHFINELDAVPCVPTPELGFRHALGKHTTWMHFRTGDAAPTVVHGDVGEPYAGGCCKVCGAFSLAVLAPCCVTWPVQHHGVHTHYAPATHSSTTSAVYSGPTTAATWAQVRDEVLGTDSAGGEKALAGTSPPAKAAVSPASGAVVDSSGASPDAPPAGEGKE